MSGSVNKVILVGNLGADPEVKSFADGGRVCNLRVATSESWTDRQSGERRERTEWHNVVIRTQHATGGLIGALQQYGRKGRKVYIEGKLATRKWQDNAGQDRWTTEVVVSGPQSRCLLLDRDAAQGGAAASGGSGSGGAARGGASGSGGFEDGLDDDEVPF